PILSRPPANPIVDRKKVTKKGSCKRKLSPGKEVPSHKKGSSRSGDLVHVISPLTLMHVASLKGEILTSLSPQPLSSLAPEHAPGGSTMVCATPSAVVTKEEQTVVTDAAGAAISPENTVAEVSQWSDLISLALGLSPQRTSSESPLLSDCDKRTALASE
ncbi:hypothetical protein MKW92_010833, partial [Papaver armeniacum]